MTTITSTTMTTTTTTTKTTTTLIPDPVPIFRTDNPLMSHHTTKPYRHNKCSVRDSNKLKFKMSKYDQTGYCWDCKHDRSTRSMSSTGSDTSLPEEFEDRIYHADARATSFDFPWFVRVGIGFS